MSEANPSAENLDLKYLKIAHDHHATVCHLLKTRVQFFHEEFQGVQELVGFYGALRDQLRAKIEEIEPPVQPEKKEPFVIDAGDITPKSPEANH